MLKTTCDVRVGGKTHCVRNETVNSKNAIVHSSFRQNISPVGQRSHAATKLKNMSWSQIVAKKRISLMHATFEYNIHNNQQDKAFHSKMWRTGSYPGRVLLDMTSRFESSMQLMSIEKQHPSRITVAITKEDCRKIAEINFDPLDPAIGHILKEGIALIKEPFFIKTRKKHLANKGYLKELLKNRIVKQIAIAENKRSESFCDVGATGDVHLDDVDDIGAVEVDDIGDVNTTEVGEVSAAGASSTIAIEEYNTSFEEQFERLDPAKKWRLSTGKCVNNDLFYLDYNASTIILVNHI